jgi:hypothetical protein
MLPLTEAFDEDVDEAAEESLDPFELTTNDELLFDNVPVDVLVLLLLFTDVMADDPDAPLEM